MQIICTPPEKVFKELSKVTSLKQPRQRKSIASRGRISIFSAKFDDESSDASDANYSSSEESSAHVTARKKVSSVQPDPLSASSPSLESMLKMSEDDNDSARLNATLEGSRRGRSRSPEKKLSDQQLQLVNHYLIGKQKQILDMETYFEKNLPSAVAEVVSTFSPTAETKISQHRKYDRAYEQNDIILLFKIIDQCAVLTPLDIPSLASGIRDKRRKLFQGNKSMDYYCELYNRYEKDLKEINRPTPEEDLITEFVNHLNPSYCSIISQWKHLDMIPPTLDQVQFKLKQYEAVAVAQATVMKQPGNSKLPSDGVQDVAMAASTNSHSHKGVKEAAASKDKKQQLKHTGGKQERKKLTEDEAKALGLKKLPCCGKYGTHKPEDCRSSKTNVSQVNSAESKPKSKKEKVAAVAAKGITFYDNDDEFNLVLLHQPRQSDPIPVESESVGPAVVPVQSAPVVAVSVPMATSRNDQYAIAPNIHVTERVHLSDQPMSVLTLTTTMMNYHF